MHELHDALRLRVEIFVVEQACAYSEIDGRDPDSVHILGKKENDELIAYARIVPPLQDELPHIGRIVVRMDHRGKGIAHRLMEFTLDTLQRLHGSARAALAAQSHLENFYAGYGFMRHGDEYPWDGIPHVDMVRKADHFTSKG